MHELGRERDQYVARSVGPEGRIWVMIRESFRLESSTEPQCFFTDDSVLTIALAVSILTGTPYVANLQTISGVHRAMLSASPEGLATPLKAEAMCRLCRLGFRLQNSILLAEKSGRRRLH